MNTCRILLVAILAAALPAGCGEKPLGPSAEVTGVVTLDGNPLTDAEVQLVPKNPDAGLGVHVGKTDAAGRFRITRDAPNNPVKPGTYSVLVSKLTGGNDPSKPGGGMDAQKNEVPPSYQDRSITPLTAEVRDGANDIPPFAISRSGGSAK